MTRFYRCLMCSLKYRHSFSDNVQITAVSPNTIVCGQSGQNLSSWTHQSSQRLCIFDPACSVSIQSVGLLNAATQLVYHDEGCSVSVVVGRRTSDREFGSRPVHAG